MTKRPGRVVALLRRLGVAGPLEYVVQILHGVSHPELLQSGATAAERAEKLPGDEVVPDATWVRTRAETLWAPAAAVWPWLAQMGGGRGSWPGWYPFDRPHDPAPQDLLTGLPTLAVGDELLEVVGSTARWRVAAVEPGRHLVLHSCRRLGTGEEVRRDESGRWADISWTFVLRPLGGGRTRVLARTRSAFSSRVFFWLVRVLGLGDNVMQRELLRAVGRRAERAARSPLARAADTRYIPTRP